MCLKRLLLILLVLCGLAYWLTGAVFAFDRPVLTVWTSVPAPGSHESWCGHCDRFWEDFRTVPGFAATLKSRYTVVWRDFEQSRPAAAIAGITSIPAFTAPGRRITGYTSPDDLLQRLGFVQRQPAQPPPVRPPDPPLEHPAAEPVQPAADSLEVRIEEWRQATEATLNGHQRDNDSRLASMEQTLQQQTKAGDERLTRIEQAVLAQQKAAAEQQSQLQQDLGTISQQLAENRAAARAAQQQGAVVTDLTGATGLPQAGAPAGSDTKSDTTEPAEQTPPAQPGEPAQQDGNWLTALALGLLKRKALASGLAIGGPAALALSLGGLGLRWWWTARTKKQASSGTADRPPPVPQNRTLQQSLEVVLSGLGGAQGKAGEAEPGIPPGSTHDKGTAAPEQPVIPPRATDELHQILQLRRSEGRDPLLDAAFGVFVQDEIDKALSADGLSADERETLYQLNRRVRDRVDQAAPLMVTAEE